MSTLAQRLFHLTTASAFEGLRTASVQHLAPPSLRSEGFVHLSFAHQLRETLDKHFDPESRLCLLEIAADVDGLRLEASRGGALFPHVYGPLPRTKILGSWELHRGSSGWNVPDLGARPDEDRPAARAGTSPT